MATTRRIRELEARAEADMITAADTLQIPLTLDLGATLALIAHLQLGLRHPGATGPASVCARHIVDRIISYVEASGYQGLAAMMRAGDDPGYDTAREPN